MKRKIQSVQAAWVFNAAVVASCLAAAAEVGLLDELDRNDVLRVAEFCDRVRLHQPSVKTIIKMLKTYDIVNLDESGTLVSQGPKFTEFRDESGPFRWLFRGTGTLLNGLADFIRLENRPADAAACNFLGRDGAQVARASAACGPFVDPYFEEVLKMHPFEKVIDLGCGAATRLIELAANRGCRGVGVEISAAAVECAQQAVLTRGMDNLVTLVRADVMQLEAHPAFADADLLTMFFMGHDLWPAEDCRRVLNNLRTVAPNCKRFLLCDTVLSQTAATPAVPAFTNGFELAHVVMGKTLPTLQDWLELFPRTHWVCSGYYDIGMPYSFIFDLRPREK